MSRYRITHYPQIPCKPFTRMVRTPEEGAILAETLAYYDLFQYENNIKPDYSNSTFLEVWNADEGEWEGWYRESDDAELDELIEEMRREGAFS